MRETRTAAAILVVVLGAAAPTWAGERSRPSNARPTEPFQVGLRVDPTGGDVTVLPGWTSQDPIGSSFRVGSVQCANCGTACPPVSRTVVVELVATGDVPGGYGVASLVGDNFTGTGVSQSTSGPLVLDDKVYVTVTGDVLSCSNWFSVWLWMCKQAPLRWDDPCPTTTLLHEFDAGSEGGPTTQSLVLSGSTLYGVTGDSSDKAAGRDRPPSGGPGYAFSVGTDGTGFTLIHSFAGGVDDGQDPAGSLTLSGSTLYGMTRYGGDAGAGVVFSIGTDGGGFSLVHEFAGGSGDGAYPSGSLALSGSRLYGMTPYGGASDQGMVFSVTTSGSDFRVLHSFAGYGGGADGAYPAGSLALSGSTLYGMTFWGGSANIGVLFSVGTNGDDFTVLHQFVGGDGDGRYPNGTPTVVGSTLYGMTTNGGPADSGVIYSAGLDGSAYTILHVFGGGPGDGSRPYGNLTPCGVRLCGMAFDGGDADVGLVFSIATDGSDFTILHEFDGSVDDGARPGWEGPLVVGSALYGMTRGGGDNDDGVVFKLQ